MRLPAKTLAAVCTERLRSLHASARFAPIKVISALPEACGAEPARDRDADEGEDFATLAAARSFEPPSWREKAHATAARAGPLMTSLAASGHVFDLHLTGL